MRGGKLFAKASNAVMKGYHIPDKDCILFNNIRHAQFKATIHDATDTDPAVLKRLEG